MNQQDELYDLRIITQAKYQLQQQSFQKIVTEENHLRRELARLDELRHQSQNKPDGEGEMRSIGADIVWQSWLGRSKSQLNMRLARVMATKLHQLEQVRQAYGRVLVVQELLDQLQSRAKSQKAQTVLSHAVQYSLQS